MVRMNGGTAGGAKYSSFVEYTFFLLVFVLSYWGANGVANDRDSLVSQQIYQLITNEFACFRRMNATHQIGCSSKQGGDVGVVQLVNSKSDIDLIVEKGSHPPYVALLYVESFTPEVLGRFHNTVDRVSGVILLRRNASTDVPEPAYSPDLHCPNRGYGFYVQKEESNFCPKWNEPGSEILYHDWNFPIFYISSDESANHLLDCYTNYNKPNSDGSSRDWPLCAAELESFMSAAVDTPTCIRRNKLNEVSISPTRVCDPLGDANVWSTLVPSNQSMPHKNRSVIVIAARLDASSTFDQISPGADSAVTGITAILALVKQLAPMKKLLKNSTNVSNVYFILFNGEAFDYIGSSRVVYDMMNDKYPHPIEDGQESKFPALLHMEDIMYYIEFNQLALYSHLNSYYAHWNENSTEFQKDYDRLIEILQRQRLSIQVKPVRGDMGVPPSSLQSFLAKNPDFPGVVITNHEKEFSNKFYNSIFDNAKNINYENLTSLTVTGIASIVATVGRAVEEIILGQKSPFSSTTADPELVNNILECYLTSPSCQLFQNVTNEVLDGLPYPLYVGVSRNINTITTITQYVMGYFQGVTVNKSNEDCQRTDEDSMIFEYIWMNGSCYETTASKTLAVSPAFDDVNTYDWESGLYSTWTESIWSKLRVRIFLKVSKAHEIITLISGILVFGASIVLFSWINANAESIFKSRVTEGVC